MRAFARLRGVQIEDRQGHEVSADDLNACGDALRIARMELMGEAGGWAFEPEAFAGQVMTWMAGTAISAAEGLSPAVKTMSWKAGS